MVRWLLENGAPINGSEHLVPICQAAQKGNLSMIQLLLEHGADVNHAPKQLSALSFAKMFNHAEVVEYLLARGATDPQDDE